MKSRERDDESPVRPSGQAHTSEYNGDKQSAVDGNERMTALAGAVLLVLILVELVSAAILRTLLSIHVFVGVLLAGPLIVKLGSTGWRFLRYYTGSPAFVRRGPPHLALRAMVLMWGQAAGWEADAGSLLALAHERLRTPLPY